MTCSPSLRLILPYPPSVNHIYQRARNGGVYLAPRYRRYLIEASTSARGQAREQGIATFTTPVSVDMIVTPPARKRRRDLDNVLKATLDALTQGKILKDDSLVVCITLKFGCTSIQDDCTSIHPPKLGSATLTIFSEIPK